MTIPALPTLDTGGSPTGWLHSDWRPEPTVVLGVLALIVAYLWITGPKNRRADGTPIEPVTGGQRAAFVAASLIALVALNPPLDDWADNYLLTAHMAQHLLLTFASAPLWLAGTPGWLLAKRLPSALRRLGATLTRPVTAFVASNAVVVGLHLPPVYDLALRSEPIHILQHLAFVAAALIGWWPVFGVYAGWPRLNRPLRCVYLFASTIPTGILGAFITLGGPGFYEAYRSAPGIWGISRDADQESAGLMMWVLTNVVYLLIITVIFFQWASGEDAKERRRPAADAAAPRADARSTGATG